VTKRQRFQHGNPVAGFGLDRVSASSVAPHWFRFRQVGTH
jgi:hypothetical protein